MFQSVDPKKGKGKTSKQTLEDEMVRKTNLKKDHWLIDPKGERAYIILTGAWQNSNP